MTKLTFKQKMTIVIEFIVTEIISFIIQLFIPSEKIQNIKMKTIIDNAIIYGTILIILVVIFQVVYWYIVNLNKKINQQSVIIDNIINYQTVVNKYNDIMIIRFEENYKANVCQVLDNDIKLFSKEELQDLKQYLNQKEQLRIEMKGRNETLGNVC